MVNQLYKGISGNMKVNTCSYYNNGSGTIHVIGTYAPTEMFMGPFMVYGIPGRF